MDIRIAGCYLFYGIWAFAQIRSKQSFERRGGMRQVLIVATDGDLHDALFSKLGESVGLDGEIALTSATSVREGAEQFGARPDFDAIVVAVGDEAEILPCARLVRGFRAAGFDGPIFAVGEKDNRQELVRAGCNYQTAQHALPDKLIEVLGL
jgi:hypothetical protein